jgi:predicted aspartyl protease
MGYIEVYIGIGSPKEEMLAKAKGLVDTGATFRVIPEKIAKERDLALLEINPPTLKPEEHTVLLYYKSGFINIF